MAQHVEIECKYRVSAEDVQSLQERLSKECSRFWCVNKHDVYYTYVPAPYAQNSLDRASYNTHTKAQTEKRIRIRKEIILSENEEKKSTILTYKDKATSLQAGCEGIETNKEYEAEVSDGSVLHVILQTLGAKKMLVKKKIGRGFEYIHMQNTDKRSFIIELVEVPPLGYFCEIETLLESKMSDKKNMDKVTKLLLTIAYRFNLSRSMIEKTPYTELLYAR